MRKNKISSRTKKLALGTALSICATIISVVKDTKKQIHARDIVIFSQDTYIYELEHFIIENITGYEFPASTEII